MFQKICKCAGVGWTEVLLSVLLKAANAVTAVASARLIGRLLAAAQEAEKVSAGEIICLAAVVLGELFLTLADTRFFGIRIQETKNRLYDNANSAVNRARYQDLIQKEDGDLYQRATEDSKKAAAFLYNSSLGLLSSGIAFAMGIAYLSAVDWRLAPVYGAVWLCVFVLQFWLSRAADAAMETVFARDAQVGGEFRRLYRKVGLIRSYGYERQAQEKLGEHTKGYAAAAKSVWARRSLLVFPMTILSVLPVFVMFVFSSYLAGAARITVAELVSVTVLLIGIDSDMSRMPTLFLDWRSNRAGARRYLELASLPRETLGDGAEGTDKDAGIFFQDVSFSYGNQVVLRDIGLKIDPGEKVAIVGRSGSGKSSLIKLIAGLLSPSKGMVTVSGRRPDTETEVRKELSCVFQQGGPLFQKSVAQNIGYGRDGASQAQMEWACHTAVVDFAADGMDRMPASELSGGQKRRVEIARAALKGGGIVLLDEITSELDTATKGTLLSRLKEENVSRTVVFVSHDWEEIRLAGRVLVLDQGRIVQDGMVQELIRTEGVFRDLFLREVSEP